MVINVRFKSSYLVTYFTVILVKDIMIFTVGLAFVDLSIVVFM